MKPSIPLALAFVLSAPCVAQDTVRLRNGTVESGRIEAEEYDGLRIKAKKGKEEKLLKLTWQEVAEVSYGASGEYQQAINQLNSGNVGAALPRLQTLLGSASLRKEMKPVVQYQFGCGQMRAGQYVEAAATMLDLGKTAPKSRYVLPAIWTAVECFMAVGDLKAGSGAVDAAVAAAAEAGVDASYLTTFEFFRALLAEAGGDVGAAKLKYQAVSGSGDQTGIATMARLGVARCDRSAGMLDEARAVYRSVIQDGQGNDVLAAAWNGLADIALQDGVKARSAEKINDALFMYLRGVVEYAPAPGERTSEYERALAGSSEAFRQLAELETDEALKKQHQARSRQRLDQLRKEFPKSPRLPK